MDRCWSRGLTLASATGSRGRLLARPDRRISEREDERTLATVRRREVTVPPTVPCPSCGAALPPATTSCPVCGLPLTGPGAAELWEVDQQLAALRERRARLLAALQREPQPVVEAAPGPPMAVPARRGWPAQQVLLAVGALLVLVAASVFLAVAWDVIGVGGQVGVMALVTMVAGGSSVVLARRGLRASAEALAVLAV